MRSASSAAASAPNCSWFEVTACQPARAALAERSIPNSPLTLERLGPNHYSGVWVVPAPGSWKLQLIIETAPGSSSQLTATVEIPG